ncbi:MAG: CPBP family intramembrane metalloprotease [Bacteroidales bacterium]|nr:CPBP family intramembrane metalloprotease [Bacteroidales bacterium]
MTNKAIIRILIFYIIGITLSNVFRFDLFELSKGQEYLSPLLLILTSPLGAIGLLIGSLISMYLLKKERKLSFSLFGTSRKLSVIMMLIPIVLFTVFGVQNLNELNIHSYGLAVGISAFIYCFCEEIGWRGYLQDELSFVKEWQRVIVIGFLWYLWHLPFVSNHNIVDNLQFLGWMIFGSWGIGKITELTKSIIAATCFHMVINILMFNSITRNGLAGSSKLIILGVSIVLWILILIIWGKEKKTIANNV